MLTLEDENSVRQMRQIDNNIEFILNEEYILNTYNEEFI
jgi:hypothetical protein